MSFFDDIGKKITQTSQDTAKKAKDMAYIAKLNSQISEETKVAGTYYAEIGRKFYGLYRNEPPEECKEEFANLANTLAKIEELRTAIQKTKNVKVCPNCDAHNELRSKFCTGCGTRLEEEAAVSEAVSGEEAPGEAVEEEDKFCNNCGKQLDKSALFCVECGAKIEN